MAGVERLHRRKRHQQGRNACAGTRQARPTPAKSPAPAPCPAPPPPSATGRPLALRDRSSPSAWPDARRQVVRQPARGSLSDRNQNQPDCQNSKLDARIASSTCIGRSPGRGSDKTSRAPTPAQQHNQDRNGLRFDLVRVNNSEPMRTGAIVADSLPDNVGSFRISSPFGQSQSLPMLPLRHDLPSSFALSAPRRAALRVRKPKAGDQMSSWLESPARSDA